MATTTTPPTPVLGLPAEQLQQWLEWVRDDQRQITARVDYMLAEQKRLTEQEELLARLTNAVAGGSRTS
jgi:hypothetical protein